MEMSKRVRKSNSGEDRQGGTRGRMDRGENGGIITREAAYPHRESLKVEALWDTTRPETTPTTPIVGCSYSYS